MARFALKDRMPRSSSSPREEELYSSKHFRLILHSLDAGQVTPEAHRKGRSLVSVLSGAASLVVRGEREALEPGDASAVSPGIPFAIGATQPSQVLVLEAPGPGADHFPKSAASDTPVVTRASSLPAFSPARFVKHSLLDSDDVRCDYLLMESGQMLPPHNLPCDVAFLVREGRILVTLGSEEGEAGPGDLVIVRAGETRGIRALERSIVLQAVSPRPGPEMRREVAEVVAPEPLRDDD